MSEHVIRHDWSLQEIEHLLDLPFNDLLFRAQAVHRARFDPNAVQVSTLLSIKTGACPEDCGYCSQSVHHDSELERERLLPSARGRPASAWVRPGATPPIGTWTGWWR